MTNATRAWIVLTALSASLAPAARAAVPDPFPVYDSTQIALGSYIVIKRLWVEGWRSALGVPHYRDEKAARAALLDEAARVGADAVVNLFCLGRTDALFNPTGYYCYGNAIRFKKERRVPQPASAGVNPA